MIASPRICRAGILGSHGMRESGSVWTNRIENLRDAEIEQFEMLFRSQNVAGLDVTMDYQSLVGVLHREQTWRKVAAAR